MIETSRRSLITGLVALVAAPAIVKVASLMPVNAALQPGNNLLTLNQITREAMRRFRDSNRFIRDSEGQYYDDRVFYEGEQWDKVWLEAVDNQDVRSGAEINARYQAAFVADGAKIGSQLRIRLPNDFIVLNEPVPVALGPLALAAAAVTLAPAMLEKPVTRRFWGK